MATTTLPAQVDAWLQEVWASRGTDLLVTADAPPLIRIDGSLTPLTSVPPLTTALAEKLVNGLLSPQQRAELEAGTEVDFSFTWRDQARIRGNAFRQRGSATVALRVVPHQIPTFDDLRAPEAVRRFGDLRQGMVLVTGPTGSGKSTTLAALIDHVNQTRPCHIVTIEDPMEYVHTHKRAAVSQREVGSDTTSFEAALRSALREDPDVILVGEMRDLESIQFALTLAETGHLVFGTLHTNDSAQAIDRLVDVFPGARQAQIRVQLANALSGVVYQRLVPMIGGGMVAAYEVLVATPAIRNLIREGKSNQLRNVVATHQSEGMQTLEGSLTELVASELIAHDDAIAVSAYPKEVGRSPMAVVSPPMPPELVALATDQSQPKRRLARR
ncbi:MAG TPA: PilT/PilU family type 4a pilus ATPase [Mycobacteriales bacterium]|nr:PilT/PilU family type 4a pilus ATPase [Mycobacteriales bacterium]